MRTYTTILISALLLVSTHVWAQKNLRKYNRLVKEAGIATEKEDYQTSILNYSRARIFQPRQSNFLDERIKTNISTLEYQRNTAEQQVEKAEKDLGIALQDLENSRQFAAQTSDLAKANANAAQALFLGEESPDLALALAYQNYQTYPDAPQSAIVLQRLLDQQSQCIQSFTSQNIITNFALNNDNSLMAIASNFGKLELRYKDGMLFKTLRSTGDIIKALTFSSDGNLLAVADISGVWSVWSKDGELVATHRNTVTTEQLFFINNNLLIINRLGNAAIYDLDGVLQRKLGEKVVAVTLSDDGKYIYIARKAKHVDVYKSNGMYEKSIYLDRSIHSIKLKNDLLFLSTLEGKAELWNLDGEWVRSLSTEWVHTVDFLDDYLLTASKNGEVKLWDQQGRLLQNIHPPAEHQLMIKTTHKNPSIYMSGQQPIIEQCETLINLVKTPSFTPTQLIVAGFNPNAVMLEEITDEIVLEEIFNALYQQQNWELLCSTYERLSKTIQDQPEHLLRFYIANQQLQVSQLERVQASTDPRVANLFAAYFYEKQEWNNAHMMYQKVLENELTRTPQAVLRWFESGTQLSDSLQVSALNDYGGAKYWKAYGRYFAQQEDWETARVYYDTLVASQAMLSPITIMEWYQVNERLEGGDFDYLLQYNNDGHSRYFANFFLQEQDYDKAVKLYRKLAQKNPNSENLLGVYASSRGLGEENISILTGVDSTADLQAFGDYFVNQNEPEQAKIFYKKLLEKQDIPLYRDQLERLEADMGTYSFRQYFLPRDAEKLKEYSSYFYQKGKQKADGQRVEDYQKAAIISEQLLDMEKTQSNRQRLAYFYNLLAWEHLFVSDFTGSAGYSLQEKEVKARQKYYRRILPASTLLAGDFKKSKKYYRKFHKQKAVTGLPNQRLKKVYLLDLETFKERDLVKESVANDLVQIEDWLE